MIKSRSDKILHYIFFHKQFIPFPAYLSGFYGHTYNTQESVPPQTRNPPPHRVSLVNDLHILSYIYTESYFKKIPLRGNII